MKLKNLTSTKKYYIDKKSKKLIMNSICRKDKNIYYLYHVLGTLLILSFCFACLSLVQLLLGQEKGFPEFLFISGFLILSVLFIFFHKYYHETINFIDNKIIIQKNEFYFLEQNTKNQNISPGMKTWLSLFCNVEREHEKFPYHDNKFKQFYTELQDNINHQDKNGDTILHYILEQEPHSPFVAQALLMNADLYIKNNQGITPYDLIIANTPEYVACLERLNLSAKIHSNPVHNKPVSRL